MKQEHLDKKAIVYCMVVRFDLQTLNAPTPVAQDASDAKANMVGELPEDIGGSKTATLRRMRWDSLSRTLQYVIRLYFVIRNDSYSYTVVSYRYDAASKCGRWYRLLVKSHHPSCLLTLNHMLATAFHGTLLQHLSHERAVICGITLLSLF